MLLDDARSLLRTKHMSLRTEKAYIDWMERFLRHERSLNNGVWKHPAEMGRRAPASRWGRQALAAFATFWKLNGPDSCGSIATTSPLRM